MPATSGCRSLDPAKATRMVWSARARSYRVQAEVEARRKQWDNEVAEAAKARKEREPPKASEPPPEQLKQPPDLIPLHSAFPIEEAKIPVRDWIIPYLLLKRAVTMLVARPVTARAC